jgi:hypothetical protein
VGDWVYYGHCTTSSIEKFRELAQANDKGGAAIGWNMVCVSGGGVGQNKYIGFGMSDTSGGISGLTLAQVKNSMIDAVGGDRSNKKWAMGLKFICRADITKVLSQLRTLLSAHSATAGSAFPG